MEEFIVEVNRTLTFQRTNKELRYKPDDPFIRTIVIGIRPKESKNENDWIAYIDCKIWNISSQKETVFWNYALEHDKEQGDKTFSAVCNYLKKNSPKKSFFESKIVSGWAVYISELTVYEDMINQYPSLDHATAEAEILNAMTMIIKQSFLIKPTYIFIGDMEQRTRVIGAAGFEKIGFVDKKTIHMKSCK